MVYAKRVQCRVEASSWLSPSVLSINFSCSKPFGFEAGQFVAVVIPTSHGKIKRCYSLASSPELARLNQYELCVKFVPGGIGSTYLAGLTAGGTFEAFAPYGHFTLRNTQARNLVFISTATGIAPLRSMVLGNAIERMNIERIVFIAGSRTENEILYPSEFEALGVEVIRAVSRAQSSFQGFNGRVTDYLNTLPPNWCWQQSDFYICGNPDMVFEVENLLKVGHAVKAKNIYRELFAPPTRMGKVISLNASPRYTATIGATFPLIKKAK